MQTSQECILQPEPRARPVRHIIRYAPPIFPHRPLCIPIYAGVSPELGCTFPPPASAGGRDCQVTGSSGVSMALGTKAFLSKGSHPNCSRGWVPANRNRNKKIKTDVETHPVSTMVLLGPPYPPNITSIRSRPQRAGRRSGQGYGVRGCCPPQPARAREGWEGDKGKET